MEAIHNRGHISAEHIRPTICVTSSARGVNKQIWLTWTGGFREDRFDVSISEGCGVSLLASNIRGIYRENQGWRQWNPWFGSVSITDVLLVRDYICSSVWGQSINNSGMIAINTTGPVDFRSVETWFLTGPDRASEALKGKKKLWCTW